MLIASRQLIISATKTTIKSSDLAAFIYKRGVFPQQKEQIII